VSRVARRHLVGDEYAGAVKAGPPGRKSVTEPAGCAEDNSGEADRLLPEVDQAVSILATQYAYLQGFLTGATGLEPATSGVTGRRSTNVFAARALWRQHANVASADNST